MDWIEYRVVVKVMMSLWFQAPFFAIQQPQAKAKKALDEAYHEAGESGKKIIDKLVEQYHPWKLGLGVVAGSQVLLVPELLGFECHGLVS